MAIRIGISEMANGDAYSTILLPVAMATSDNTLTSIYTT